MQFKVHHHNSNPYRPKTNGTMVAAKKSIKKILQKKDQDLSGLAPEVPIALLTYRTSTLFLPLELRHFPWATEWR